MLQDTAGGAPRAAVKTTGRCRVPGRIWHEPPSRPIPDEPGTALIAATVSVGRQRSGRAKQLRWHDGAETTAKAATRALHRKAHGLKRIDGSKSGCFATTLEELTHAFGAAGLFPKSGLPPVFGSSEWPRYAKRNRGQTQRICQYLEEAGIAVIGGESDNLNKGWRTVVELLPVRNVDPERLAEAKDRHRRGRWERRRARSERRGVKRDLRTIKRAAEPLTGAEKRRLHKEFQLRTRGRSDHKGDLRPQREASRPSVAKPSVHRSETSASPSTSQRRGAHAHGVPSLRSRDSADRRPSGHGTGRPPWEATPGRPNEGGEGPTGAGAGAERSPDAPRGGVAGDLAAFAGLQGSGARLGLLTAQIASTAPSAEQVTPAAASAIVAAWWQLRRGLSAGALPVVDDAAAVIDGLAAWRRRAAELEHLVDHRPAGWPTSGAAMLFTLAVIRDVPPGGRELGEAADELLRLMGHEQRFGGRAIAKLGSHLPPAVPAGYEGVATMRRRLTEQLAAAGDNIDAYPTLAAAERAAVDHENSGRLSLGPAHDWDAPWNRDKPQPTLWPAPSVQRSWRRRLLPPLPHGYAPPATPVDHLADPATYAAAIDRIRSAQPGIRVTDQIAEDLVHAFHATRFGIAGAIAVRKRWRPKGGLAEIQGVVTAYEALGELRPRGWPASGLAAILTAATWRDPGSYEHDGTPLRLDRPDKLPMALGLLRLLIKNMDRHAKRDSEIETAKRRGRGRGGRSPQHHARKATQRAATAPAGSRLAFRTANNGPLPAIAETPAQTYQRIRRQLLAIGRHPAEYPSLEDAELDLIDLETAGELPDHISPSPRQARQARFDHARSTGPAAIAAADWTHLAAAAAGWLADDDARRLAEFEAVSIHDGRLILTGPADTLAWAKVVHLTRLLERVALQLDIAHSANLIAAEHATVFRPTAELRGPADNRAAIADRYADERRTRWAYRSTDQ